MGCCFGKGQQPMEPQPQPPGRPSMETQPQPPPRPPTETQQQPIPPTETQPQLRPPTEKQTQLQPRPPMETQPQTQSQPRPPTEKQTHPQPRPPTETQPQSQLTPSTKTQPLLSSPRPALVKPPGTQMDCGCDHRSILSSTQCGVDAKLDQLLSYVKSPLLSSIAKPASSSPKAPNEKGKARRIFANYPDLCCMGDILDGSGESAQDVKHTLLSKRGGVDTLTTAAVTVLEGVGKAHWVTASLLLVASVLERMDLISSNKDQCLNLVYEMYTLAKYIKSLKSRAPLKQQMEGTMEESIRMIVQGAILCSSKTRSSWWIQFFWAKEDNQQLEKVRRDLETIHKHLMLDMVLCIYDCRRGFQYSRQKLYPTYAVGIQDRLKAVATELELESEKNVIGVVVFGFGGIGKTVLADAVYASLNCGEYAFSKVSLFDTIHSKPNITKVQKQILDDLSGKIFDVPRTPTDGQLSLLEVFQEKACFVYIDNVLDQQELRKLLPKSEELSSCKKLRLLMTARTSDVKDALFASESQDVKVLEPGSLDDDQAKKLLQRKFDETGTQLKETDMKLLVEVCRGVPLCLELVGNFIANHLNKMLAIQVITQERNRPGRETYALQAVDFFSFAFDTLPESYQEAFLDVCAFFMDMPWEFVQLLFGVDALEALQRRALLKIRHPQSYSSSGNRSAGNNGHDNRSEVNNGHDYSIPEVHDVILDIAKRRYEATRITQVDQLRSLLSTFQPNRPQKELRRIKGIRIAEDKTEGEPLQIPAAALDVMSSSLRHFSTQSHVPGRPWGKMALQIQGSCLTALSALLTWNSQKSQLPFRVQESRNLKWLKYAPKTSAVDLSQMPPGLLHLEVRFRFLEDATPFIVGDKDPMLTQLSSLAIYKSQTLQTIPAGLLSGLKGLNQLSIIKCEQLLELPNEFHKLPNMNKLEIRWCSNLSVLPPTLKECTSLKALHISSCDVFQLSDNFCHLSSLEILKIERCKSIKRLPNNFEQMSSLRVLSLQGCESLSKLPDNFSKITSLKILDISDCQKLEEKWISELRSMKSLEVVYIKGCPRLIRAWQDIAHSTTAFTCKF